MVMYFELLQALEYVKLPEITDPAVIWMISPQAAPESALINPLAVLTVHLTPFGEGVALRGV